MLRRPVARVVSMVGLQGFDDDGARPAGKSDADAPEARATEIRETVGVVPFFNLTERCLSVSQFVLGFAPFDFNDDADVFLARGEGDVGIPVAGFTVGVEVGEFKQADA